MSSEPAPFETVREIALGYGLSRCLHVVAELGVADALDETPRTTADLAVAVGAHPDALGRVLRLLSGHGVFEMRNDRFSHSPASRLLRTDHPQSARALVRMCGFPMIWATYELLSHSVRTGLPAADKIISGGYWSYFSDHPQESRIFNEAMAGKAHAQVAGVIAAYDFSSFGLIGDIGGGRGHLLRAVLDSAPAARGVLFDLPHVIEDAADVASERLTLQAGDFFKDDLPACDVYLIMEVIHDWGDEESVAILRSIRRVARPSSKLLLIEAIVPDDPGPHWSKSLDVLMLTLLGGRQRTRTEYEALLDRAGFSFEREIKAGTDMSILEAGVA
jgi:hypothetical protein